MQTSNPSNGTDSISVITVKPSSLLEKLKARKEQAPSANSVPRECMKIIRAEDDPTSSYNILKKLREEQLREENPILRKLRERQAHQSLLNFIKEREQEKENSPR
jgi:DNA-nicking Smr family endonuclease